jgi:ribosomal protein S1
MLSIVYNIILASVMVNSFTLIPTSFSHGKIRINRVSTVFMSDVQEQVTPTPTQKKYVSKDKDLSKFAVGDKFDGTISAVKQFGVFVKIAPGIDALVPKSTLSKNSFDRLKALGDAKSTEPIQVQLSKVDTKNQTISAKYIHSDSLFSINFDTLDPKDLKSKYLNGTVVSHHDFGMFVSLKDADIDGLVPASLIPTEKSGSAHFKELYP